MKEWKVLVSSCISDWDRPGMRKSVDVGYTAICYKAKEERKRSRVCRKQEKLISNVRSRECDVMPLLEEERKGCK